MWSNSNLDHELKLVLLYPTPYILPILWCVVAEWFGSDHDLVFSWSVCWGHLPFSKLLVDQLKGSNGSILALGRGANCSFLRQKQLQQIAPSLASFDNCWHVPCIGTFYCIGILSEYHKYGFAVKKTYCMLFLQVDAMAMVQNFVTYLVQSLQLKLLARNTNTALSRYRNDLIFFPFLCCNYKFKI